MRIEKIEVRQISLPLVTPFRTSQSTEYERNLVILQVHTDLGVGWAECSADDRPVYWADYLTGALDVLRTVIAPELFAAGELTPPRVGEVLGHVKGHRVVKSAVEMGLLDAWLRAAGMSLSDYLGGTRPAVPVGVSVSIKDSVGELLDQLDEYLAAGYARIKLKIEPGKDIAVVRAVREHLGDDVLLQVDANAAYTLADAPTLARLDEFALTLIEQPLVWDDLRGHARLGQLIRTPICLDESITSARSAADAIAYGACRVINIKPSRVGGYLEARRIHDVCQANQIPVWCGGMLESGIGRAANLALASLPGFTLPGDISATARYFEADITRDFTLTGGLMTLPTGPGIGVDPIPERLEQVTVARETLRPS